MTDHPIRNFESAAAVRHVGEGLLARTLPKAEWTHEADLAAALLKPRTIVLGRRAARLGGA